VGTPTYAEKILPGELRLDWDRTAPEIGRVVRVGRAWTHFRGRRLGIVAATLVDPTDGEATGGPGAPVPPGTLVGTEVVAGDGGRVRLVTVQPEGKRPMDADAWRNGVRPDPGERLGR
jgi:methionyl-tRNA formyltransferase